MSPPVVIDHLLSDRRFRSPRSIARRWRDNWWRQRAASRPGRCTSSEVRADRGEEPPPCQARAGPGCAGIVGPGRVAPRRQATQTEGGRQRRCGWLGMAMVEATVPRSPADGDHCGESVTCWMLPSTGGCADGWTAPSPRSASSAGPGAWFNHRTPDDHCLTRLLRVPQWSASSPPGWVGCRATRFTRRRRPGSRSLEG